MPTPRRTAVITGVAGQDGSYLAELLLERGYRVVGAIRPTTSLARIEHLRDRIELRTIDLLDAGDVVGLVDAVGPSEIYNLAGHSFVPSSWNQPGMARDVTAGGVTMLLDAVRAIEPTIRFYQASSSEVSGTAREAPPSQGTPPDPRNPYGQAKAGAHLATARARDNSGVFAVCGILYNHESPRRGPEFVSRKITDAAARIALGKAETIAMGSLDAERDWGFAGDYVRAMW